MMAGSNRCNLTITAAVASLMMVTAACSDYDKWTTSPSAVLTFSADTVAFDTLISTVPSSTRTLIVHNRGDRGVRVSRVALQGGGASLWRANVDGQPLTGGVGEDFEIRRRDSLVVRLECTLPETGAASPQPFSETLTFWLESGVEQAVQLTAQAQDAYFVRGLCIENDSAFVADKPYVVYDSLVVDAGTTLTLPAGCTLMFHEKAGLAVRGRLQAQGTPDKPVTFRGDRTDRMFAYLPYDNTPGRWEGISLLMGSTGNVMDHCDVHSASYGIRADSTDLSQETLMLLNSVVHNIAGDGLHLEHAAATVANTQVSNTLGTTVYLHGGRYTFTHCTVAQFYPFSANRGNALFLANEVDGRYMELQRAWFNNCVVTGYGDDVIFGSIEEGTDYRCDYHFSHCFLTTPEVKDDERYVSVTWDSKDLELRGGDNFQLFDAVNFLYDFTPDSLSAIRNIGALESAMAWPMDRLGRSRTTDAGPDAGCYEYTPETGEEAQQ